MQLIKGIGVVIAGFLAIVALIGATDAVLTGTGAFPDKPEEYTFWMLCIALAYRTVFAVLGGLVAGKLAPSKLMKHVISLAAIGTLIGLAGVVSGWNLTGYPHWYSIALTILTFPAIWYGGKLAISRKKSS